MGHSWGLSLAPLMSSLHTKGRSHCGPTELGGRAAWRPSMLLALIRDASVPVSPESQESSKAIRASFLSHRLSGLSTAGLSVGLNGSVFNPTPGRRREQMILECPKVSQARHTPSPLNSLPAPLVQWILWSPGGRQENQGVEDDAPSPAPGHPGAIRAVRTQNLIP